MNKTFTFRQLEADPSLCAGMTRLWQDSESKTVTFRVPEVEPVAVVAEPVVIKSKAKGKRSA